MCIFGKPFTVMYSTLSRLELGFLFRMARQCLAVPAISASPERLSSSVGLESLSGDAVKSDLRGSHLDTTLIDVMWAKQAP